MRPKDRVASGEQRNPAGMAGEGEAAYAGRRTWRQNWIMDVRVAVRWQAAKVRLWASALNRPMGALEVRKWARRTIHIFTLHD